MIERLKEWARVRFCDHDDAVLWERDVSYYTSARTPPRKVIRVTVGCVKCGTISNVYEVPDPGPMPQPPKINVADSGTVWVDPIEIMLYRARLRRWASGGQ